MLFLPICWPNLSIVDLIYCCQNMTSPTETDLCLFFDQAPQCSITDFFLPETRDVKRLKSSRVRNVINRIRSQNNMEPSSQQNNITRSSKGKGTYKFILNVIQTVVQSHTTQGISSWLLLNRIVDAIEIENILITIFH